MRVVIHVCVPLTLAVLNLQSVGARLHSAEWEAYKEQHGKVYEDLTEDVRRYANYLASKQLIQEHTSKQSASSFRMELNHMADWSINEFTAPAKSIGGNEMNDLDLDQTHRQLSSPPAEIDWRNNQAARRVVSKVGDQGQCSSGWAFATAGVLEGQQLNRSISFVPLSAQNVLDCSATNDGCKGGLVSNALIDLAHEGGIESDKMYPYIGEQNKHCKYSSGRSVMAVGGMLVLKHLDELTLSEWLAWFGPVAIEIDATEKLKSYKSGVFEDSTCSKIDSNHSVLIVGYGTDKQAGHYWIVKNSWSTNWGEQGYFRLKRGVNACGLLNRPTIPIFI